MSLEAIKKVAQTEAETKQRKAEAAVTAKKLVADAEQAGNESLRKARTEAEAKSRELLAKAEERAAVRTAECRRDYTGSGKYNSENDYDNDPSLDGKFPFLFRLFHGSGIYASVSLHKLDIICISISAVIFFHKYTPGKINKLVFSESITDFR